jgi:hypothetical protein
MGFVGLVGGLEYLIRNDFVEVDSDEILEDSDKRIRNECTPNERQQYSVFSACVSALAEVGVRKFFMIPF